MKTNIIHTAKRLYFHCTKKKVNKQQPQALDVVEHGVDDIY